MRPVFCGNFEYDTRQGELERLFKKYGRVERVDMKSGFAFVYMEDERDAEDAIRGLDRYEFGRKGRRLRVEWTKEDRSARKPASSRRSAASSRPSKTLFVINFDPYNTRTRDLERHFDPYGKILNIRIRRNFAFIQFESQEDATKALDATNMSKLMGRVISVEYTIKDDDDRRNGSSPDRGRDRSPRRRSMSPYRRERGSPDYGRGRVRGSPDYGRGRERGSPDYGHGRERASPDYGRGRTSRDRGRVSSPGINGKRGPSASPNGRARSPGYGRDASPSPRRERVSPGYDDGASPSPLREDPVSPEAKREPRDSPGYSGAESPPDRYRSRSPVGRERSRS